MHKAVHFNASPKPRYKERVLSEKGTNVASTVCVFFYIYLFFINKTSLKTGVSRVNKEPSANLETITYHIQDLLSPPYIFKSDRHLSFSNSQHLNQQL